MKTVLFVFDTADKTRIGVDEIVERQTLNNLRFCNCGAFINTTSLNNLRIEPRADNGADSLGLSPIPAQG